MRRRRSPPTSVVTRAAWRPTAGPGSELVELGDHRGAVPGRAESRRRLRSGAVGEGGAKAIVRGEAGERTGQRGGVTGRDQEAGPFVVDDLDESLRAAGDHGPAGEHAFDSGVAEGFDPDGTTTTSASASSGQVGCT